VTVAAPFTHLFEVASLLFRLPAVLAVTALGFVQLSFGLFNPLPAIVERHRWRHLADQHKKRE
jgi:hypothetical protein